MRRLLFLSTIIPNAVQQSSSKTQDWGSEGRFVYSFLLFCDFSLLFTGQFDKNVENKRMNTETIFLLFDF